jgi:antitoxin component YwqK of YwqJK toxin-antitoxin module
LNQAKAQLISYNELQFNADTNKIDNLGKQGIWIERYPEAGSIQVNKYKNNLLHGKCFSFYSNGNLYSESNYYNGKRTGFEKSYTIKGELVDFLRFNNDTTIICRFDTTEKLIGKYRLINGVEDSNYDSTFFSEEFIEKFRNPKDKFTTETEFTEIPGVFYQKTYVGGKLVSVLSFIDNKPIAMYEYQDEKLKTKTVYNRQRLNIILKRFHYDKNEFCFRTEYWNDQNILYKTKHYKRILGNSRIRCFKCKI